jgi:hypothetical protein
MYELSKERFLRFLGMLGGVLPLLPDPQSLKNLLLHARRNLLTNRFRR